MSTQPCKLPDRSVTDRLRAPHGGLAVIVCVLSLCMPFATHALTSDRDQEMNIFSNYSRIEQNRSGNGPSVTLLKGDVQISQGSLKASADAATIEQAPADAKDAQGNAMGGQINHVIMTGEPAHLEQKQDGGGLMRATARKIDYHLATNTVELSGNVVVNQQGRGEFRGAHMVYNTLTGTMESGAESGGRVHMRIEPRAKPAAPAAADEDAPDESPADTDVP